MALAGQGAGQSDFGGGIFRGRSAPDGSVYDALNALVTDERLLARRGGSAYRSNANAGSTLLGLWDGQTLAGARTVAWGSAALYQLGSDEATPAAVAVTNVTGPPGP